jgi:hypothetical protein
LFSPTVGGGGTSGGNGSTAGATGTIYRDFKPRGTMFSAW